MIIIFGWLKERGVRRPLKTCYCYNCKNAKTWLLLHETEWVTFFAVKTIPFIRKHFLFCEGCGDIISASAREVRLVSAGGGEAEIERLQLAGKTENQRRYLLAARDSDERWQ